MFPVVYSVRYLCIFDVAVYQLCIIVQGVIFAIHQSLSTHSYKGLTSKPICSMFLQQKGI